MPSRYVYRFLDTVGDGTGTKNAIGDYSSTATDFRINAPPVGVNLIARMLVSFADTSPWSADEYGNLGAALTNGITVGVYKGDVLEHEFTDGIPITTNGDWGRVAYDASLVSFGSGNDYLRVRWTFTKGGQSLHLYDDYNFRVTLNDNFTGLASQYFLVQGTYVISERDALPPRFRV